MLEQRRRRERLALIGWRRHAGRGLAAGALVATLLACPTVASSATASEWPHAGGSAANRAWNKQETKLKPRNVAKVKLAWNLPVSHQSVVAGGRVISTSPTATGVAVTSRAAKTGAVQWQQSFTGFPFWMTHRPAVANGRVVVLLDKNSVFDPVGDVEVRALKLSSGATIWSRTLRLPRDGRNLFMAVEGELVVVLAEQRGGSFEIVFLNAATGVIRGSNRHSVPIDPDDLSPSVHGMVLKNGVTYVAAPEFRVRPYDSRGRPVSGWPAMGPSAQRMLFTPEVLYTTLAESDEYSMVFWAHPRTGLVTRTYTVGPPFTGGAFVSAQAVDGNRLFFGGGNVGAMNRFTGAVLWVRNDLEGRLTVANNVVYGARTRDGVAVALDAATGATLHRFPAPPGDTGGSWPNAEWMIADGQIFAPRLTQDGQQRLVVYRLP